MAETSNTKLRTRISAGLGALLFLVTASGLTIAAVWDNAHQKQSVQNPSVSTVSCDINTPVTTNETLPAPDVYKADAKVTALQTTDLTVGSGQASKDGDCLQMKYYGTLASNGTMFDENFTKPQLLQFTLGAGQVIPGWDQGLKGMKVGGTRRVVIPSSLGYGANGSGAIPANSDLVFVVKLVSIKK